MIPRSMQRCLRYSSQLQLWYLATHNWRRHPQSTTDCQAEPYPKSTCRISLQTHDFWSQSKTLKTHQEPIKRLQWGTSSTDGQSYIKHLLVCTHTYRMDCTSHISTIFIHHFAKYFTKHGGKSWSRTSAPHLCLYPKSRFLLVFFHYIKICAYSHLVCSPPPSTHKLLLAKTLFPLPQT